MSFYLTRAVWRAGEPREADIFPQLPVTHPGYHRNCPVCAQRLSRPVPATDTRVATAVQVLVLGPGVDVHDLEAHRAGRRYTAYALLAHALCLGTAPERIMAALTARAAFPGLVV